MCTCTFVKLDKVAWSAIQIRREIRLNIPSIFTDSLSLSLSLTHSRPSMEKSPIMASLPLLFTSLLGLSLLFYLYTKLWLNPNRIREKLRHQGVSGPKPSLFYGNTLDMKRIKKEAEMRPKEETNGSRFVSDYTPIIYPYLIPWRETYGHLFLYSVGTIPILHITEPNLVKAISHCTPFELGRPEYIRKARKQLFGKGIVMANSEIWAHERKIIAQEFFMHKVKLTMVIQETLCLFSPVMNIQREALHDMKLENMHIPKGTIIQTTISMLHRDRDVWGPDTDDFNPNRFANGISGACKYPHMYMPFGFGPTTCAGQNLAMVELKIVLSLLLSRFSFDLSPSYVHLPAYRMTIEPKHGLPLTVKKIKKM